MTAMGVRWLQVIDYDTVEGSDLVNQGYLEADLGLPKVQATGDMCLRINSRLCLLHVAGRFRRRLPVGNAVFCCVGKIEIRRAIWEAVRSRVGFFVDGRINGQVLRVLTACDDAGRGHYPSTLCSQDEAHLGACTAKTSIFHANIAAGMMIAQFTKHLQRLPVAADLQFSLLTSRRSDGDRAQ